jgi:hypothetical protein
MDSKKIIILTALLILIIGSLSTIYVFANQLETSYISINNKDFTIDQIFLEIEPVSFKSLNYTGVSLKDLIIQSGVEEGNKHNYIIIGSDGYQKTVNWNNINNGLLTFEKEVIFSDLPKMYRVKNIVKIEVI